MRLLVFIGLFWVNVVLGASVTLAWDPVQDPIVSHYYVYWGVASRNYTNSASTEGLETNLTVSNLVGGVTYYFAATSATDSGLESVYSAEVSYTVPLPTKPIPPGRLRKLSQGVELPHLFDVVVDELLPTGDAVVMRQKHSGLLIAVD